MDPKNTNPDEVRNQNVESDNVDAFSIIKSVFAAFFGVQSDKNRERDFASGKFWHFLVAGMIFLLLFMASIYGAVRYLLATTPAGGV